MNDDLTQLLIYVVIGVIGLLANAYKNKMKKQQASGQRRVPGVPRNLPADPERDFGPELGPLMELFDIPKKTPEPYEYETVEQGPSVEEAGMAVDTEEASAELAGMKVVESDVESFEEGQSDIQKMIAKYEAIRKELDQNGIQDDIAMGEIVSVEAEDAAKAMAVKDKHFFDPRKAIIYSEILKRKEY
jgi:hypothetical protein